MILAIIRRSSDVYYRRVSLLGGIAESKQQEVLGCFWGVASWYAYFFNVWKASAVGKPLVMDLSRQELVPADY